MLAYSIASIKDQEECLAERGIKSGVLLLDLKEHKTFLKLQVLGRMMICGIELDD